jgi:HEAT repeat protein
VEYSKKTNSLFQRRTCGSEEEDATVFLITLYMAAGLLAVTVALGLFLVARKVAVYADQNAIAGATEEYRRRISALLLRDLPDDDDRREVRARLWRRVHAQEIAALADHVASGSRRRRRQRRLAVWTVLQEIERDVSGGMGERLTIIFERLGFVAEAIRELKDRRLYRRAHACRRLGVMRSQQSLFALVGSLQDDEELVRREASDALIEVIGVAQAIGPILQNIRSVSNWFSIRLSAAILSAGSAARDHLVSSLDSPYRSLRVFAARMLGELRDHEALPPLLERLEGMETAVKAEALCALGMIGGESVYPVLVSHLAEDNLRIRAAAVAGLGSLGSPRAAPHLLAVMMSGDLEIRRAAAEALAKLSGAGRQVLEGVASGKDPVGRAIAEEVLDCAMT